MTDITAIADRIRTYVANCGTVTLTQIKDKTKDLYDPYDLNLAFQKLHTFKDIHKRVKDNDVVYSLVTLKDAKPSTNRPSTNQERARWNKAIKDYYLYSPLVTPEERECYTAGNSSKECACITCDQIRFLHQTKEQRAIAEFERVREIEKSL